VGAAAVCLVVSLAALAGSVGWVLGERRARQRDAEARALVALAEAAPGLRQGNPHDPALVAAAERAGAQLDAGAVGSELRERIEQLQRDREMLAGLETARLQSAAGSKETVFDYAGADALYAEAFKGYDLDVSALDAQEAADRIGSSAIRSHLVAALDDWALVRDNLHRGTGASLTALAELADDDPWRRRLRRAKGRGDRAALEKLAEAKAALNQPPGNLVLHARALCNVRSGAVAERLLRRAQAERPADFWITFELAGVLSKRKPPDRAQVVRFLQAALALRPRSPVVHLNLGALLAEQGKPAEAEEAYRQAIQCKPDLAEAHSNLGGTLLDQGKLAEAEAACRRAVGPKPDYALAHCNLGHVLRRQGRFADALAALKRGHELGHRRGDWTDPPARWVRHAEQLVALDARLARVLGGKAEPAGADERLALAHLCQEFKKRYAAAARFYAATFAVQPTWAANVQSNTRYNAACAAALAGCGEGRDAADLTPMQRLRWRRQALTRLRADLRAWLRLLAREPGRARAAVGQQMRRWLADTDFAGVRRSLALRRLPAEERAAWAGLWADVAQLRDRTKEPTPRVKESPDNR
jgi:serine/threonine-protein kinase